MNRICEHSSRLGRAIKILVTAAALWAAPSSWAYSVRFHALPLDSAVFVDGTRIEKPKIVEGGFVKLSLTEQKKPHDVRFESTGYEAMTFAVGNADAGKVFPAELTELRIRTLRIESDAKGAAVSFVTESGAVDLGAAPATKAVTFRRPGKGSAWDPITFVVSAVDFQSETLRISTPEQTNYTVSLARLHEVPVVAVIATDDSAQTIRVVVKVDDKAVATGLESQVSLDFVRSKADKGWNDHLVSVEDPQGVYQSAAVRVGYAQRNTPVRFTLKAVKEALLVPKLFPQIGFGSGHPAMQLDRTSAVAMIDTEEPCPAAGNVVRITNFGQRAMGTGSSPLEYLNAFAVTPDGKSLILAVLTETAQGPVSALYVKSADKDAKEKKLLLENSGYLDTCPSLTHDGDEVLVFQSNRRDNTKPDLFSIRVVREGEDFVPRGGLVQLTTDSWFNFAPAPGGLPSAEVVFLSVNPQNPAGPAQVMTVRSDGSQPTLYSQRGVQVNALERRKIVFTRQDPKNKNLQIVAASLDSRQETILTENGNLATANCSMAATSFGDTKQILFTSDCEKSSKGRPQNDIFVMNADGSGVRRLTSNESDDIAPAWSPLPSEADVVYFLSNRGGAYNVWRLQIIPER